MITVMTIALGIILLMAGFVFCVIPIFPGPILAYSSLLTFYITDKIPTPSLWLVTVCGVFTALVVGLDMIMPGVGAKKFDCSKWGVWGSLIGALVGAFFFPWGLLLGPYIGALAGELLAHKRIKAAAKGALGAFIGFTTGIALKLGWCFLLSIAYLYVLFT